MIVLDQAEKELQIPSPITPIFCPLFDRKQINVFIKRDDLIHPTISGNKWRKLKYTLLYAIQNHYKGVITFGGAFSNHIVATAKACQLANIPAIGIIRGEKENAENNTLSNALHYGMQLQFVSREEYRQKNNLEYVQKLKEDFPNYYVIPEGGACHLALDGVAELLHEQNLETDFITTACGTGATMAGLIKGKKAQQKVIGFPVLKNGEFLIPEIEALLHQKIEIDILKTAYHFRGYAKTTPELITFLQAFEHTFEIEIDPVYTTKHFYGLMDLIRNDYFPKGSSILAVHTGGIQGKEGMKEKLETKYDFESKKYFE